jgi:hypothetical protein
MTKNTKKLVVASTRYEKIKYFTIKLAIEFLICNDDLQLNVFLQHEWYWTSCKNCNEHNSPYMDHINLQLLQLHYS